MREYEEKGYLNWYDGVNLGAKFSFLDVINKAGDSDYYALCDQYDIWLPNKLAEAVKKLEKYSDKKPLLYYSETMQVNNELKKTRKQFHSGEPYKFGQIMIKNHASGCTMVFNKTLQKLLKYPGLHGLERIPYHDHWIYMVCLACGGEVIYDTNSYILYRQHGNNVIGANRGVICKLKQNGILNHDCNRYYWAKELYSAYENDISDDAKDLLKIIINYKTSMENKLKLALNRNIKPKSKLEKIIIFISVLQERF